METSQSRKYFKPGQRKTQSICQEGVVFRTGPFEEDLGELSNELQKKMCLNEEECFFEEENKVLYTDPCEPEAEMDDKVYVNQEITFNPQSYLNNEHSILA